MQQDHSLFHPANGQWLERLSYSSEGILYEDDTVQIGVKSEYHAALGRLALFFGNKHDTSLADVRMTIEYPNSVTQTGLDIRFHDAPVTEIHGKAQVQEMLHVECKGFFSDSPVLRMTYEVASGPGISGKRTLVLRLPVFLTRFVEGVTLEQAPFFERWKIIGGESAWGASNGRCSGRCPGAPREAQKIFPIKLTKAEEVDLAKTGKVMSGSRLSVLSGIDPNPSNVSDVALRWGRS